jgi:hypothetical protein
MVSGTRRAAVMLAALAVLGVGADAAAARSFAAPPVTTRCRAREEPVIAVERPYARSGVTRAPSVRRRARRYSSPRNSQMAIASMSRPSASTTKTSSSTGTCQPNQVMPGASAARAASLMSRWLKTTCRIGSTA